MHSLLFPTHTHTALDHVRAEGCSLQDLAVECAKTGDVKYLLLVVQSLLQCQLVLFRKGIQINLGKWSDGLVDHMVYMFYCVLLTPFPHVHIAVKYMYTPLSMAYVVLAMWC